MKLENRVKSTSEVDKSSEKFLEANFEDAFELTGHGKFNHVVLLTSGLIMLNVSMESVGMSYVVTAAECELHLSSRDKGLVSAAAFIGIICTSFLWGYLGDKLGRRAVMLPALLASAVLSIASSFCTDVWSLLALRVLTGCLVSASSATIYAYLGETHVNSRRAAAIAWGSAFISLSFIILPGLAWLFIPGRWSFYIGPMKMVPWRAFVWVWCIPGLMAAVVLFMLPESPRFLLSAKGPEKALPVLAKMYAWNQGGIFPVQKIITSAEITKNAGFSAAVKNIVLMFRPPLLRCVFISHISMFAVFMISSGLYVWVPDILNSILSNTSKDSVTICQIIQDKLQKSDNNTNLELGNDCQTKVSVGVFPISMTMGVIFALTYFAIGFFINKIGKKTLYSVIMFICGLATVAAVFVPNSAAATGLLILALCSGCAASILPAIAVDVFPTCLRAMAMCVMYMVGRAGAAIGSYFLGATLQCHCEMAFIVFGVVTAGSTVLLVLWPRPENVRAEMERKGLSY